MKSSGSLRSTGHVTLLAGMCLAIFLTVTAIAMPGPLLVEMSLELGSSVAVVGQLVTVAAGTWALTAIVAGPFSDAYGRKPVLVLGAVLLGAGSIWTCPDFVPVSFERYYR